MRHCPDRGAWNEPRTGAFIRVPVLPVQQKSKSVACSFGQGEVGWACKRLVQYSLQVIKLVMIDNFLERFANHLITVIRR